MSRVHPIGLRIASKKVSPRFIGVGKYYSYNQLKYNIVISKSIKQLSEQLAIPTCKIINRFNTDKKDTKNVILYPNTLPISIQFKAKQLFDSQYVLNRRRLYSSAIYITRLLMQQFEKNYNDFSENTYTKPFSNNRKSITNLPLISNKCHKWTPMKLKSQCKCPSMTFVQQFFRISQKTSLNPYDIKIHLNTQNKTIYQKEKKIKLLQKVKQNRTRHNSQFSIVDSDPYLMLSYGVPFLRNFEFFPIQKEKIGGFYFLVKKANHNRKSVGLDNRSLLIKNNIYLASLLALDIETAPIFILKTRKNNFLKRNNETVSKRNNQSVLNPPLHSGRYADVNNFKKANSNKCGNVHIIGRHSFFFEYLANLNQNRKTLFKKSPEWPLPISFSQSIRSVNYTNWQKRLTSVFTAVKTEIKNTPNTLKQEVSIYCNKGNSLKNHFNYCLNVTFSKHLALKELYNKPKINYQIIKQSIILHYLTRFGPVREAAYQKRAFKENKKIKAIGNFLALAKETRNKQSRLYINPVTLINKTEGLANHSQNNRASYTVCPRPSAAILNLKNTKKLTKQIESFRSDIKLLAPLGLLLHRSFSEPIGINCISAINNKLEKTYCNPFLKNLLFKRTSGNFLKSNYMNSQRGLLRTKNTILFDFAYTKEYLINLGLKKTSVLMQQLLETGHSKLWLRKLSSVRL